MIEIKKIKDKEEIEVLSQFHCRVPGKSQMYQGPDDDCLSDCTAIGKPRWYVSDRY